MNKFSETLFMALPLILLAQYSVAAESTHKYSLYSKDIGCSEWPDKRSHEICESFSENLEWEWTGHATVAPGWKTNWASVKNVYCDQKITKADLPLLEKMCGSNINPSMSCLSLPDPRFASGIEFLIKTIISLNQTPKELKGTVYDPEANEYLLKDGCRK